MKSSVIASLCLALISTAASGAEPENTLSDARSRQSRAQEMQHEMYAFIEFVSANTHQLNLGGLLSACKLNNLSDQTRITADVVKAFATQYLRKHPNATYDERRLTQSLSIMMMSFQMGVQFSYDNWFKADAEAKRGMCPLAAEDADAFISDKTQSRK